MQVQWQEMFSSIISRARVVEVLSMGVAGTYDGAIQLVSSQFDYFLLLSWGMLIYTHSWVHLNTHLYGLYVTSALGWRQTLIYRSFFHVRKNAFRDHTFD